jgi:hypothetical protein
VNHFSYSIIITNLLFEFICSLCTATKLYPIENPQFQLSMKRRFSN